MLYAFQRVQSCSVYDRVNQIGCAPKCFKGDFISALIYKDHVIGIK